MHYLGISDSLALNFDLAVWDAAVVSRLKKKVSASSY